ncbi:hypothetical protein CC86DRAFT_110373 [Ophiobolus disseminans]|uniref:Mid2 domain-containing protein n=1 Tax=Ophiobolus disseminans TaxID=1469910 RepID=A0A6A6ZJY4_9PLEO|nr:hypothetical protein CC86DRAFT_110373 [Ophiobolus disseminans]
MLSQDVLKTSLVALACLFSVAVAQPSTVSFAYPPQVTGTTPLLIINVVDTITFQWTSNYQKAYLWVFCDEGTPGGPNKVYLWANKPVPTTGNATYSPFFDSDLNRDWKPNRPFHCHADLNYENEKDKGTNGPGFNVTSISSRKATTYALQYTTDGSPPDGNARITIASSHLASTTTNPAATATSTTSTSPSPPADDSGLSRGATAGIAMGVVAGICALASLAFMVWRNKRKVDKLQSRLPDDNVDPYSKPQGVELVQPYQDELHQGAYAPTTEHEMEADNRYSMYGGSTTGPVELEPLQAPQELPEGPSSPVRRA